MPPRSGGRDAHAGSPQEKPLPPNRKEGGLPDVKHATKTHPRRSRRGG